MASKAFLAAVKNRRTFYQLQKSSTISSKQIKDVITHAILHAPSPFNMQAVRVILLLGDKHDKLWDITKAILRKHVPADKFSPTEQKLDGFKAGFGTVCFYSRLAVRLMCNLPSYTCHRSCFLMLKHLLRLCSNSFHATQIRSLRGLPNPVCLSL